MISYTKYSLHLETTNIDPQPGAKIVDFLNEVRLETASALKWVGGNRKLGRESKHMMGGRTWDELRL
ncbi:MAG TPA: hypothetical protein VM260_02070 [Pirellula sp.]|nr:hypothetical protein [Pirellula sp.]